MILLRYQISWIVVIVCKRCSVSGWGSECILGRDVCVDSIGFVERVHEKR